jgi:dolichol-phosphate mannosyltransferase
MTPRRADRMLVVLPTYCERPNIERVLERILAAAPDLDVLVVDDDSPDGTGAMADKIAEAEPRVRVLHRPTKSGLGTASRAGFQVGLAEGYGYMAEIDADLSHDPADLPRLLAAARTGALAIGTRYLPGGGVVNWPRRRLWLSRLGTTYANMCLALDLSDATSGFRVFPRAILERIPLASIRTDGYAFQIEMAHRVRQMGEDIIEVPIVFTEREEGFSKMSGRIVREALLWVGIWGVRDLPRRLASKRRRGSS